MDTKKLLFYINREEFGPPSLYLYVGSNLIIPFKNIEEWIKFAEDMLHMTKEIKENLDTGNY